jgi:hypothetical protein
MSNIKIPAYRQAGMSQIRNPPHPSPLPNGERDGVRGYWRLEFGICLGFETYAVHS